MRFAPLGMAYDIGPPDIDTPPVPSQSERFASQSERFELAAVDITHNYRVGFDKAPVGRDWVKMCGPKNHQKFVQRAPLFLGMDAQYGGQFFKYTFQQQFFDADGHTTYQYLCQTATQPASRSAEPHSLLVRQIQLSPAVTVTETKDERTPGRSIFVAHTAFSSKWITAFVSDPSENLTMHMICNKVNLAGVEANMITPNQGFTVVVDGRMPAHTETVKRKVSAPAGQAKRARRQCDESANIDRTHVVQFPT